MNLLAPNKIKFLTENVAIIWGKKSSDSWEQFCFPLRSRKQPCEKGSRPRECFCLLWKDGSCWMVIPATPVTLLLAFQRSASGKILLCTLQARGTHASVQTGPSDPVRSFHGTQFEGHTFSFMSEDKQGWWGRCLILSCCCQEDIHVCPTDRGKEKTGCPKGQWKELQILLCGFEPQVRDGVDNEGGIGQHTTQRKHLKQPNWTAVSASVSSGQDFHVIHLQRRCVSSPEPLLWSE